MRSKKDFEEVPSNIDSRRASNVRYRFKSSAPDVLERFEERSHMLPETIEREIKRRDRQQR